MNSIPLNAFYKVNVILIPKLASDNARTEDHITVSLMNVNAKIFNTIPANLIQQCKEDYTF